MTSDVGGTYLMPLRRSVGSAPPTRAAVAPPRPLFARAAKGRAPVRLPGEAVGRLESSVRLLAIGVAVHSAPMTVLPPEDVSAPQLGRHGRSTLH